jgi:formate dehydrogenase alpha subunit
VVASWRESELSRAADLVLPLATAAERRGTFVSVGRWLQRIEAAFPAHGQARPAAEVLIDLLGGLDGFDGPDGGWRARTPEEVLALMASEVGALAGLDPSSIPADGVELEAGAVRGAADDGEGGA